MKMFPTFRWPRLAVLMALVVFAAACDKDKVDKKDPNSMNNTQEFLSGMKIDDPHSFAMPGEAAALHLDLLADVNFDQKQITGTASYVIENRAGTDKIIFDTRELDILRVTAGDNQMDTLTFTMGEPEGYLGSPLMIDITPTTSKVNIEFATRPGAAALQWLDPVQTAGKKHPFLFTQSQAILARTWLPCQDGPGMRFTYKATITVPNDLMALMSASNPTKKSGDGVYEFEMRQPIPAYLMALAVGDLEFREIGGQTGVYAEPSMLKKAHHEFGDMQKMLEAAEKLYGKYSWDRYDVIVLPPSFPFGGMENPRLTFATPTILAGDRSLTALIAHELAHSWSGNLVTNANWNDFWLNEGFTVYFERRIMEALYGESYANMLALLGYQDLESTIDELGPGDPDTKLKLALKGRDPDDGMTDIAYEKGNFLLVTMEKAVGREKFDAFLRQYFKVNAFKSMTTEAFVAYVKRELIGDNAELAAKIDLDTWIYGPGLPEGFEPPVSDRFEKVDAQRDLWWTGTDPGLLEGTDDWTTHEWLHFIRKLPAEMNKEQMAALDKVFKFTDSGNSEIQAAWYEHVIRNGYSDGYKALEKFLTSVGRRKFLKPLYKALSETPEGLAMAKEIYGQARPNYHSVSTGTID
ncbi:MAG: M1 family metallopeptidase, partial [Bacteroidota bacterium]